MERPPIDLSALQASTDEAAGLVSRVMEASSAQLQALRIELQTWRSRNEILSLELADARERTEAAESAPRDRMPSAIGLVQTAQRLGPAVGPVIGGVLAGLVGLRRAFLVTAGFYAIGLLVVWLMYEDRPASRDDPGVERDEETTGSQHVTFRSVLAFQNFVLMLGVIFGLQFVDRSFGPILPNTRMLAATFTVRSG